MSSSLQDIQAQDFILTPGRYVGIAEQEDDGEPFAEGCVMYQVPDTKE